jgi:4-amino-4-deoxy-L-arabinose transferase-like glycosyltransferase
VIVVDELRDAWKDETRDHRLALAVILATAVAVRAMYLSQPMRYDESVTYMYFVRLPWQDALSTYTYPNNHLFHTFLAKAAVSLFGNHPWALRLPAVLAGMLAVPATYVVARLLYGGRAALIAVALAATSGMMVLFSTNARGYMLMVLAFLLLVVIGVRLQRGVGRAHDLWLQFAAIAALGLWTIPSMLYPLGCVVVWLALTFLVADDRTALRQLALTLGIAAIATIMLYWPVFLKEGLGAVTRNRFVIPAPWLSFFSEMPGSIADTLRSWSLGWPPVLGLALAACALVALRRHAATTTTRIGLPLAAFVASAWLLVITHRVPFVRTWLWIVPLAAALAGAGLVWLLERRPWSASFALARLPHVAIALTVAAVTSLALSFAVMLARDTGTFREAEEVAALLRPALRPGDRVLALIPTNGPLDYYLHRQGGDRAVLVADERAARRVFAVVDRAEGQELSHVIANSAVRDTAHWSGPAVLGSLAVSYVVVYERKHATP